MNCSPNALIEAAKCYRCIPRPVMRSTIISLLCQWANAGGPVPPEPCVIHWTPEATVVDWVAGGMPASGDLATFLTVDPTTVTDIDASALGLTEFSCPRYCPNLQYLYLNDNNLAQLDCTGCANLLRLNCYSNPIMATLTIAGCNSLTLLSCHSCSLTDILGMPLPALTTIVCYNNQLTALNTGATSIYYLNCRNNLITDIDLSFSVTNVHADVASNRLTEIEAAACSVQDTLYFENQLVNLTHFNISPVSNMYFDIAGVNNAVPCAAPLNGDIENCLIILNGTPPGTGPSFGNMGSVQVDGGTMCGRAGWTVAGQNAETNLTAGGWTIVFNP